MPHWAIGGVRRASTSSTGLGARGPALERPLVGIRLLQKHVVAPDEGQQVLVDDVLIGQAASGATLSWGEHLRGDGEQVARDQKEQQGGDGAQGKDGG